MQIRWNPPAEAEAIDSIFSQLDDEHLADDDPHAQLAPPAAAPSEPENKPAGNS